MRESYRPRHPHSQRPHRAGGAAVSLATAMLAGTLAGTFAATPAIAATPAAAAASPGTGHGNSPGFTAVQNSERPTTDKITGVYTAKRMSVEVALAPRDGAGLDAQLAALYTEGSGQYHKFLGKGRFDRLYAPAAATVRAVTAYLRGHGLIVSRTGSPFLIRAAGSSARVDAVFRTTLSRYRGARGVGYFANSMPVYVPASLSSAILGVIGLTDTIRPHPLSARQPNANPLRQVPHKTPGSRCEAGYPTRARLFRHASTGASLPRGYGGGPGCSGLTPSQTNSLYGAPKASPRTTGAGADAAIFELSAYRPSDPATWARHFYGKTYKPLIRNVLVDGGPLHPDCPSGDTCPAGVNGYAGDVEADADIEQEMAVAPRARLYVYNAPNDVTGQTVLDEYTAIANADAAATVSTSWGACESDDGQAYAKAENTVFEQMAAQGQSVFAAAGDDGALDCVATDGSAAAMVDDPGAQPWVTSAGGTSLETFNPGAATRPSYPRAGTETAWNVDDLCSQQGARADNGNLGGPYWCGAGAYATGAGGGGSSEFWGAPSWQNGPGVASRYTRYGLSSCALAADSATPCRQVPDVSADADEFTPYAEYCTGGTGTPNSVCAQFGPGGWFGIGGTSLAAPLWAALITDRDGYRGHRAGDFGPLAYGWLRSRPRTYFHDIARPGKPGRPGTVMATDNGVFPAAPGYDEATGIGTPKFAAVITRLPAR